jgi:hypothetical protein
VAAKAVQECRGYFLKEHGTLVSVCGKGLGADDVVMLAGELVSMEGLMELDISGTGLWAAGTAVVAGFLALCIVSSGRKFRIGMH